MDVDAFIEAGGGDENFKLSNFKTLRVRKFEQFERGAHRHATDVDAFIEAAWGGRKNKF